MGNCFTSNLDSDSYLDSPTNTARAAEIEKVRDIAKNSDFRELKRTQIDIPNPQHRAITLGQLRAIYANVQRRCVSEAWADHEGNLLTPETVTLYDVNKYVIKPFTLDAQKSFVECIAAKPKDPKWFVSHWWGEPVKDFIACLEQHRRDFNEKDDVTYWICAYANNQWNLNDDLTDDPAHSAFTKAMQISEGTISILDSSGVVFSRVWCIYELYRTLVDTDSCHDHGRKQPVKWCIYTAHQHNYESWSRKSVKRSAVGIIPGGAPCDSGYQSRIIRREKHFPFNLIESSLETRVEEAQASVDKDRRSILNSIASCGGRTNLEIDPPTSHHRYEELNEALRAHFCASPRALQGAMEAGETKWNNVVHALSKGTMKIRMHFDFGQDCGWEYLLNNENNDRAAKLIASLPRTLEHFSLRNAHFSPTFTIQFAGWLQKSKNLKRLDIYRSNLFPSGGTQVDSDPELLGKLLVQALVSNDTIEHLDLDNTDLLKSKNIHHLAKVLETNRSLKHLECNGRKKIQMDDEGLCILAAEGISLNNSLQRIDFRRHKFCTVDGMEQLTQALLKNKGINYMIMKGNTIDISDKMEKLCQTLKPRTPPMEVEYIKEA